MQPYDQTIKNEPSFSLHRVQVRQMQTCSVSDAFSVLFPWWALRVLPHQLMCGVLPPSSGSECYPIYELLCSNTLYNIFLILSINLFLKQLFQFLFSCFDKMLWSDQKQLYGGTSLFHFRVSSSCYITEGSQDRGSSRNSSMNYGVILLTDSDAGFLN